MNQEKIDAYGEKTCKRNIETVNLENILYLVRGWLDGPPNPQKKNVNVGANSTFHHPL
jgi:hypothetical protein